MADIPCSRCREPWEVDYLKGEAPHEAVNAPSCSEADQSGLKVGWPDDVIEACLAEVEKAEMLDRTDPLPDRYGQRRYHSPWTDVILRAIARGRGCPSCWEDPSRIIEDDGEGREETMRAVVYDAVDDGDPAELLGL